MIGIFGGTFDPVHNGHMQVALGLGRALPFDELRLLPCGLPPHRAVPQASAADRVAMLQLAIVDTQRLVIDERELQQDGPSYMIDTLASLREELGDEPLVLILGWDAFIGLPTWERWREIAALAHLLVVQRPGCEGKPDSEIEALMQRHQVKEMGALMESPAGCILLHPLDVLDVSSTEIRALIAAQKDAGELLPAAVWAYIKEHDLYLK